LPGIDPEPIDLEPRQQSAQKSPERERPLKPASLIAVLVFSLVAAAHLVRLSFQVEVTVAGRIVPMWVSVVGFFVAAVLAFTLSREGQEPQT